MADWWALLVREGDEEPPFSRYRLIGRVEAEDAEDAAAQVGTILAVDPRVSLPMPAEAVVVRAGDFLTFEVCLPEVPDFPPDTSAA